MRSLAKIPMAGVAVAVLVPVGETTGGGSVDSCSNLTAASGGAFSRGYCSRESLEGSSDLSS